MFRFCSVFRELIKGTNFEQDSLFYSILLDYKHLLKSLSAYFTTRNIGSTLKIFSKADEFAKG